MLQASLGRLGLAIPDAPLRARMGERAYKALLARLTTVEKQTQRGAIYSRTIRSAYRYSSGCIILPRCQTAALLAAKAIDGVRPGFGPNEPLPPPRRYDPPPRPPLYDYQEAALDYLLAGPLAQATPIAYMRLDTGLGKSRLGAAVAAERGEPALVVVPTKAIAEQWVDEAREIFPTLRVAQFINAARNPPSPATHDIVVIIVNTFRAKTPEFLAGYGLVVIDEAHEYHGASNLQALWLAGSGPAVLGLSATPLERPDGLDAYVLHHLGPVIEPDAVFDTPSANFTGTVRRVMFAGDPRFCTPAVSDSGTVSAVRTIESLTDDPARLRLVADEVERLLRLHETLPPAALAAAGLGPRPPSAATEKHPAGAMRRHGVMVFAEHREYLPRLRDLLLERGVADVELADTPPAAQPAAQPAPAISVLRGGVGASAMTEARRAGAHVVLTTYGYSRRGVSLAEMTSLVLATPRRHGLTQILGRITRRGSDESIVRVVVDIVDTRSALRGQTTTRAAAYKQRGWPITTIRIAADETNDEGLESDDDDGPFAEASAEELLAALYQK
jgi:hypothetical protein